MNARVLNHITGRLSLRPPQAESLSKLVRALEAAPELLGHERDVSAILSTLKAEFPALEDFERDFPSLCFAKEALSFNSTEVFSTPKPERLLMRILQVATVPNDLVLDSFAGSGTTGAVAHKMGRRWIMIELGEHCHTHIIPRLQKVIDGEDPGGIAEAVSWQGGGGFRYYKLAPSLIINDRWGNAVVNPEYNAAHLAEALCKIEGFTYAPSEVHWWQHGNSSERDFIYVTTQNLSSEQLQALSDEVGSDQSLLVCCAAFHGVTAAKAAERWPNLTLKKIPKMVLARCEWGHDDYSLNVANLPMAQPEPKDSLAKDALTPALSPRTRGKGAKAATLTPDLFGDGGEGGI